MKSLEICATEVGRNQLDLSQLMQVRSNHTQCPIKLAEFFLVTIPHPQKHSKMKSKLHMTCGEVFWSFTSFHCHVILILCCRCFDEILYYQIKLILIEKTKKKSQDNYKHKKALDFFKHVKKSLYLFHHQFLS